jgi:hypothetical protein
VFRTVQEVVAVAFGVVESTVSRVSGAIGTAFATLEPVVTKVAGVIGTAFRSVFNGIARAWNNTVGRLSFDVPDWVPVLGGASFDVPNIPEFANGGIVQTPTVGVIGEAGPEAVIPITRPGRAMRLLEESGLADMVRPQAGPAVMIQNAVFASATDADLVAQRVNAALRVRSFA